MKRCISLRIPVINENLKILIQSLDVLLRTLCEDLLDSLGECDEKNTDITARFQFEKKKGRWLQR